MAAYLYIEGPVGTAGPGEVDVLDVVVLDEDRRLVDEDKAALERVHEPGGGLVGAGDGGGAGVSHEAAGNSDLPVYEDLHQLGDQLEGRAFHLLLQLTLVLLLSMQATNHNILSTLATVAIQQKKVINYIYFVFKDSSSLID